jgi:hypothetical protein
MYIEELYRRAGPLLAGVRPQFQVVRQNYQSKSSEAILNFSTGRPSRPDPVDAPTIPSPCNSTIRKSADVWNESSIAARNEIHGDRKTRSRKLTSVVTDQLPLLARNSEKTLILGS